MSDPALDRADVSPDPDLLDQRVRFHDVTWQQYEALLALRGDNAAPRITYLEGELELMSPSRRHEIWKSRIGGLVEMFAVETGLDLQAAGSWTLKDEAKKRGAEPDECYILGDDETAEVPDIAIEVVWTSGGIDKLAVYASLGVPEVWFFENGKLSFHCLHDATYESTPRSRLIPDLDPDLIVKYMSEEMRHTAALRAFRDELRAREMSM